MDFQLTYVPGYTISDSSRCFSNSAVLTKTTTARFPGSSFSVSAARFPGSSSLDHSRRLTCAPNTRPFVCRGSSGGYRERDSERETTLRERFEKWLQTYNISYGGKEEWMKRFEIYKSNLQYIDHINSLDLSSQLKDNMFADMTLSEYQARFRGCPDTSSLRSNRDERLEEELQAEPEIEEERESVFDSEPGPVTAILEPESELQLDSCQEEEEEDDVTLDVLSDDDDQLMMKRVESENSSPAKMK